MSKYKKYQVNKTAKDLIKNKFNLTKTYQDLYPNASTETAQKNSSRYMQKHGIIDRAIEILESQEETTLESVIKSFKDDLKAVKPVIVNGKLHFVRDNGVILDAKKYLCKLYRLENNEAHEQGFHSIDININNNDNKLLNKIVDDLEAISNKLGFEQSGEITDGEVV